MTSRSDLGSGQGSGSSHTRLQNRPRCSNHLSQAMPYRITLTVRPGLIPATAVSGRQRPGRRSQAAGGQPCHRRLPPWSRRPGSASPPTTRTNAAKSAPVSPAGLLPLPTQALDRLGRQLPEAERVPTHPNFVRRKVHPVRSNGSSCSTDQTASRVQVFMPGIGSTRFRTGNEGARAPLSAEQ